MRHSLRALVASVAVGLVSVLGAAPADAYPVGPPYEPATPGFFSVPWGPDLYWARLLPGGGLLLDLATFDQWASQGYPTPRLLTEIRYDRAPWSPTIIAAPHFPGWSTVTETHALTFDEWAKVGYPNPTVTWTPAGIYYRSYVNTSAIYAFTAGGQHHLTFAEWLASGAPAAMSDGFAPGTEFHQWATSPEIFMSLDGAVQKLGYPQWASYGYPTPTRLISGFVKLTWDPTIAHDYGALVSWDEWVAQAFPTPAQYPTIPGDEFCYDSGRDVVSYDGLTFTGDLAPALAVQRIGVPLDQMPAC